MEKLKNNHASSRIKEIFSKYGALVLIILIMIIGTSMIQPVFLKSSNLVNLIINNNNVFLTACGMTFVIIAGGIDLSIGSLAALSGMFAALLLSKGFGAVSTVVITFILCFVLGMLSGFIITKSQIPPFVMTLGTTTIYRGFAVAVNGGYTIPIPMDNSFTKLGGGSVLGIRTPIFIIIVVFIISAFILSKTNIGRNIYAVGGNVEAARISGINILQTNMFVYGMCAAMAGLSGMILAARMYTGLPSASVGLETQAIAAVVLGGTSFTGGDGDVSGTILGVLILAIMLNCMTLLSIPSWLQDVFQGLIIIIAVIFDKTRKAKS